MISLSITTIDECLHWQETSHGAPSPCFDEIRRWNKIETFQNMQQKDEV